MEAKPRNHKTQFGLSGPSRRSQTKADGVEAGRSTLPAARLVRGAQRVVFYLREAHRRRIAPSSTTIEIKVAIPPSQTRHAESGSNSGKGPPLS